MGLWKRVFIQRPDLECVGRINYLYVFLFSIIFLNKHKIKLVILIYLALLSADKLKFESIFLDCARLFFSGVFVYYLYMRFKKKFYLTFISFFLILISFIGNFKLFLLFPSILLFFVSCETFTNHKYKKSFQLLGNLTYAMYLLHIPIQLSIILTFGYLNIFQEIFIKNYFFIAYIVFMMSLSFVCYKFYEKPLNNKIRFFFLKNKN